MSLTPTSLLLCWIVGITDGDTLVARCPEAQIKVRLAEIDAPEKKQPWGTAAKQALSTACYDVQAEIRPMSKDRYGRLVAHVKCHGNDASYTQVHNGMAWVYDKYAKDPSLFRLQVIAQNKRAGLWSQPDPVAPWIWRKEKRSVSER